MTIPIGSSTLAFVRDEKLQDRHASPSGWISCPMTEFGHPPPRLALCGFRSPERTRWARSSAWSRATSHSVSISPRRPASRRPPASAPENAPSKRKGLNAFLKAEGNKLKGMMDTAG